MHLGCGWVRRANCTAAALRRRLSSLSISLSLLMTCQTDRRWGAGNLRRFRNLINHLAQPALSAKGPRPLRTGAKRALVLVPVPVRTAWIMIVMYDARLIRNIWARKGVLVRVRGVEFMWRPFACNELLHHSFGRPGSSSCSWLLGQDSWLLAAAAVLTGGWRH
jgi:hypothetical protein